MASWDDGTHSSVRNVKISYGTAAICSIKVDYDSNGNLFEGAKHGGDGDKTEEFKLNHPDEYLTSVTGYYTVRDSTEVVTALTFKTNKRTLGPYGTKTRKYFSIDVPKDNQIIGFKGKSGSFLNDLGVHFGPVVSDGLFGGGGGVYWDDKDEFSGVKKFEIGYDSSVIHSITVTYDQTGSTISAQRRGGTGGSVFPLSFDYPGEYLVSVSGTYSALSSTSSDVVIKSLTLVTNRQSYGPYGLGTGTAFTLSSPNKQFIGFKGRSGAYLDAIGAYYGSIPDPPPRKPEVGPGPYGCAGGLDWNDGDEYSFVKKIEIGYDDSVVHSVTVEYDDTGSTIQAQRRGGDGGKKTPVTFKYPDEYLISVSGTYSDAAITSLTFTTNKTSYGPYGKTMGNAFELTSPSTQIIGFRGTSGAYMNTLGAYFGSPPTPIDPSPSSVQKLEAYGGDGGKPWDDGAYDTVKKVCVSEGPSGIHYIKFEYEKDGKPFEQKHGEQNLPPVEIALNNPEEYLTSMTGFYDNLSGFDAPVIQSLTFKTNKGTEYGPYGFESGTRFSTGERDSRIVGFHGRSSNVIHKLGLYIKPGSN